MLSKEELLEKEVSELEAIAQSNGAVYSPGDDKDKLVYAILDRQAEEAGTAHPLESKRKRTRIARKDADRVYSVHGEEGENFDVQKNKNTATSQPSLFKELPETKDDKTEEKSPEEILASIPKHRGRKSKAELEAIAAAEAAIKAKAEEAQQTEEPVEEAPTENVEPSAPEDFIPEDQFSNVPQQEESEGKEELLARLQEKVNAHNMNMEPAGYPVLPDGVWAGDPGDGTDFIPVVDLPIEDQGIVPNYDMFDQPTTPAQLPSTPVYDNAPVANNANYDFSDLIKANGVLEVMPDGYGFLRSSDYNYLSSPDDVYIANNQIKQYGLKTGDVVECHVRPPHEGEKYFPLTSIDKINGRKPSEVRDRIPFEHLTPLFPEEKFTLCGDPRTTNLSTRIVDLFSPIGKGQRALIVAQPKTGKTILMKDIANAIAANHPEAYLMMLLIDERPEEVTDMARTVNAEVIASTFDEPAERHVKIAGIVL